MLDLIFKFTNYTLDNERRDEKRSFEIELEEFEIERLKNNQNFRHHFSEPLTNNIFTIEFDYSIVQNWNQIKVKINTNAGVRTIEGTIFPNESTLLKSIFSDAEINYVPEQIEYVTARDIDNEKSNSERASKKMATEITQLLIDIQTLDSQDFAKWGRENLGKPVDETQIDNRLKRFTSAFSYMFPTKKLDRIINNKSYKSIIFKENNNEMPIENLSSGEKQIVFRGSFLLKDKKSNKGALILIDEPEISLHPSWQIKILDYYKTLFVENNIQTSQLIVATHSPFIIHNCARRDDKVIILKKDESEKIIIPNIQKFQSWTEEKVVKEAFNIDFVTNSFDKLILLEGETDELYYKKAFEVFNRKEKLEFSWIGRINENGNVEFTGDTALNQAKSFLISNEKFLKNEVILLYDNDTNKPEEIIGQLRIKIMPKNELNQLYKIGVENLLTLPSSFNKDEYYKTSIKIDKYGAESKICELDKTKLCSWVCGQSTEKQKEILKKINSVIDSLI